MKTGLVIINKGMKFGTFNGVYTLNSELQTLVNTAIKEGRAKLLIDSKETLMYQIS